VIITVYRRPREEVGGDGEDRGNIQKPHGTHTKTSQSVLWLITGSQR